MNENIHWKIYGTDDLVDFDDLLLNDEFYPFSKEGQIIDERAVSFFLKAGYVYNPDDQKWYILFPDGLYYQIRDEKPLLDIMIFLDHHARKNGNNISINNQKSIYERLRAVSKPHLDKKRDDFLTVHNEYSLSWEQPDFIPVRNGLINPETMELLPHCGYFLYPNVLGFNYEKLTYDEIINSPIYDAYLGILPDKDTLELYLWYAGLVLFSPELARVILFLYGNKGTGKTTLSLGLSRILTPVLTREIDATSIKNNKFLTSSFVGKRLVVMDEMSQASGLMDDGIFKQITGGNPVFTVEEKYKKSTTAVLTCKIMMIGNTYPTFIQDNAMIDRMFIIPCFKEQDKDIRDTITSDKALNWLFNAAHYFYIEKHPHTDVKHLSDLRTQIMLRELDKYRDIDSFIYWLKGYIGTDVLDHKLVQYTLNGTPSKEVYNDYRNCIEDAGGKPLSAPKFNQKLNLEFGLISKPTYRQGLTTVRCYQIEDKAVTNDEP